MRFDEFLLRALSKMGISHCFGIVGGEASAIRFDPRYGIQFFLVRHEFTAGIMADVFGRLTQRPQMCWATFAPGLTNLATGACSALLDRSPVLIASAQIKRADVCFNVSHQCIDNAAFLAPITKAAWQLESPSDVPTTVQRQIQHAIDGLPGPVYMSVPLDLLEQDLADGDCECALETVDRPRRTPPPRPTPTALSEARALLAKAKRPMVILGNQVSRECVEGELLAFIEALGAPVLCSPAAKGALDECHPQFLTTVNKYLDGIYRRRLLGAIFAETDLLILIGYDIGEDLKPSLWPATLDTMLLNSHDVPVENLFQPTMKCLGDLHISLEALATCSSRSAPWSRQLNELKTFLDARRPARTPSGTTDFGYLIQVIGDCLGDRGILCSDVGMHKQYAALLAKTRVTHGFLCSNVCGTFGFGLPAAMAASLVHFDSPVIALCGDGGFHSVSHDLETLARYQLPVTIIVLNDCALGLIQAYGYLGHNDRNESITRFGRVDFAALAEANGVAGVVIESLLDLPKTLTDALASRRPHLIELPVCYATDTLAYQD